MALTLLSGYHPRVFDVILSAVEPCAEAGDGDETAGQEPFCVLCGAPVGIFLAHGKEYRHYLGILTAASKPRPYKADHAPVIAWRPATVAAIPGKVLARSGRTSETARGTFEPRAPTVGSHSLG